MVKWLICLSIFGGAAGGGWYLAGQPSVEEMSNYFGSWFEAKQDTYYVEMEKTVCVKKPDINKTYRVKVRIPKHNELDPAILAAEEKKIREDAEELFNVLIERDRMIGVIYPQGLRLDDELHNNVKCNSIRSNNIMFKDKYFSTMEDLLEKVLLLKEKLPFNHAAKDRINEVEGILKKATSKKLLLPEKIYDDLAEDVNNFRSASSQRKVWDRSCRKLVEKSVKHEVGIEKMKTSKMLWFDVR